MRALPTQLSGPVLIEPSVHRDERGFFLETYRRSTMQDLGIAGELVQHNHSRSRRGVVRGMHFQPGMDKLVRCLRGAIFDVVVDIRRGSQTFGQWEGFELDDIAHRWPEDLELVASQRDRTAPALAEIAATLSLAPAATEELQ